MTCAQGLLRLLWGGGGPKLECYGTAFKLLKTCYFMVYEFVFLMIVVWFRLDGARY